VAATIPVRRRIKIGPALRIVPLPMASLTLSTCLHAGLMVAIVLAVNSLNRNQSETYVVNLVPAVAAIGSTRGQASAPPQLAPRPEESKADLPDRGRDLPSRDLPARTPSRDAMSLPERGLPARSTAPALPRPEQKELPTMPTAPLPSTQARVTTPSAQTAPPPSPPQALGRPGGSAQGKGPITVEVDNFPYAWYIATIHRKIAERWDDKALPGQQPVVVFEIGRDGQVNINTITVDKSSGNALYDRAAVRAIQDANPFPPLPDDFKKSFLRIHLGFAYSRG
jgi:TonB family protein